MGCVTGDLKRLHALLVRFCVLTCVSTAHGYTGLGITKCTALNSVSYQLASAPAQLLHTDEPSASASASAHV
ncbi:hypothetical protein IRJ41_002724 [Triplophysa rosa]|uniref:Secreted protein n=1 Tax=Triplophysa rosa TaxID=992332 RepID=A0A9W7X2N6_TRIRA|nr:hypothetical protein IRJ41_002724 [Triplophysa rosa]